MTDPRHLRQGTKITLAVLALRVIAAEVITAVIVAALVGPYTSPGQTPVCPGGRSIT